MAQKRTIDIDINTNADEAAKQFETLSTGVKKAADSAENLDAKFEDVFKGVEPLTTRLGEAEDRLYELALAGDTTSKEYQELLTKVGEYRKVQIQTDLAVDGAAQTMSQKLGSALTGATSGFAATQGAMALFGSENEALEKTLVKVQAALAIQQGVQGLGVAYKELGGATGIATKAQAAFNFVMNLNPFLLIATAIAAAIAALAKFTSFLNPAIDKLKEFTDFIGVTDFAEEELAEARSQRAKQHFQETQRQKELDKIAFDARQQQYDDEIALMEALGKSSFKLRQQKIKDSIAVQQQNAKDALAEIDDLEKLLQLTEFGAETNRKLIDEQRALLAKANSDIASLQNELTINEINENKKRTDSYKKHISDKKAAEEDFKAETQKELNDEINAEIAHLKTLAEIKRSNEDALRTDEENELLRVEEKYDALEASAFGNAEALNDIEIARLNARNEILLKFDNEAFEANQAAKERQAAADKAAADKKIEVAQAVADTEKAIQNAQFAAVESGIGLLKQFADKNKSIQATVIAAESAVGIAKIIMNTQAANAAVTAKNALIPAPVGPALTAAEITANKVSAALGIATTIAAAAKGISALGGGASPTSGGGLGGDAGGGGQAPSFNVVGDSGINQLAQLQQQPVQAFVVSGEVTTSQALDRNRVENATL